MGFGSLCLSQMLILVIILLFRTTIWSIEFEEIQTCNALKNANPCALRDAGCMCWPTIARHVTPSMVEHCGWPSNHGCDTPRSMPLIFTRIKVLRKWLDTWSAVGALPGACFSHTQCTKIATQLVEQNATLTAMHDMGTYTGPEEWCDFVGLTTHYVSKNIFSMLFMSRFSDSDVIMGEDGNTYSVTLLTCAVRTFLRPNTLIQLHVEAKFAPFSDTIQSLTVTDPGGGGAWIMNTGFGAVAKSSIWAETRAFCGILHPPGAPTCTDCWTANETIVALLAEIRPARYCPTLAAIQPLAVWDSISGIRHARVC